MSLAEAERIERVINWILMKRSAVILTLAVLFSAATGFGAGFFLTTDPGSSIDGEIRLNRGTFTNPLLECSAANGTIDSSKRDFHEELESFVKDVESRSGISRVAVTFRDLNNGPSFGVNRDDSFIPASLLKVPVLMSFFKRAEVEPGILDRKILFEEAARVGFTPEFEPDEELSVGESYTVRELLERMIIQSDNQALLLLWPQLSTAEFEELYSLLGVDSAVVTDARATLSVRQYATFFRILYNSSFLSQDKSEEALRLLSKTTFRGGLRAGVPQDVEVAHKFGERKLEDGSQHLHDCGIIYYPNHPYLLCVMSKGEEIGTLQNSIRDISRFVYERVAEQY